MFSLLLAIIGIILLYIGGDILIKGAIATARNLQISKILVSSIIVGLGTSSPELILSIEAVLSGSAPIALGNIVGSNIANILFIIGIAAVISPFIIDNKVINRDFIFMLLTTIIFVALAQYFRILSLYHGLLLLILLLFYLYYSYQKNKESSQHSSYCREFNYDCDIIQNSSLLKSIILSAAGILLLAVGSSLFLKAVIKFANIIGVSQEIIGLGVVAFGSSIPELSAAIIAATKKHANIVIAGVLGSNIFNILLTGGIISVMDDIVVGEHILKIDLWVLLFVTLIFTIFAFVVKTFSRATGCVLLIGYATYFYTLFV